MFKVFKKPHNQSIDEILTIPKYNFAQYLGMNPSTVFAANEFNKYDKIPIDVQFKIINDTFGNKISYIKWIKNNNEHDKKTLMISKYYKISIEKAQEYKQLMSKDELEKIYNTFKDLKYTEWTKGFSNTIINRFNKG
jgi:hypothetical protein